MTIPAILTIALGLFLCLWGYRLARLALALWGAAVGLLLADGVLAMLRAAFPDQARYLSGWFLGLIIAVVFGWLAYRFYAAAVVLLLGSVGWGLGEAVALALGWAGFAVICAAVGAIALALLGIVLDLPRLVIVIGTSLLGATTAVGGLHTLLDGHVDWLNPASWIGVWNPEWGWFALQIGLVALGLVVQLRQAGRSGLRAAYTG